MARKILLADDSVTAQNMGRKILTDAGYEVMTVNNGSAALKRVTEQRPDLIVLDVYMPGYSGLEVCQRLKDSGDTSRIPILLTVGKLEPFKPEDARRVSADAFIVKPFEASELLSALTRLEDRIVPNGDKPRFSNTVSGIERFVTDASEPRSRKRETGDSADTGWKSRIRFPSKKKTEEPEPEPDIDFVTPPVFRDFRRTPGKAPAAPTPGPEPVVVRQEPGLVSDLPHDITPDELDALSALVAKLDGQTPQVEEIAPIGDKLGPAEQVSPETKADSPEAKADVAAHVPESEAVETPAEITAKAEPEGESQAEVPVTAASVPEMVAAPVEEAPAPIDQDDEPYFATAAAAVPPAEAEEGESAEPPARAEAQIAEQAPAEAASERAPEIAQPVIEEQQGQQAKVEEMLAEAVSEEAASEEVVEELQAADDHAPTEEELAEALRLLTPVHEKGAEAVVEQHQQESTFQSSTESVVSATHGGNGSHWRAEVVELSPEEASVSLEAEMFRSLSPRAAQVTAFAPAPASHAVDEAENSAPAPSAEASTEEIKAALPVVPEKAEEPAAASATEVVPVSEAVCEPQEPASATFASRAAPEEQEKKSAEATGEEAPAESEAISSLDTHHEDMGDEPDMSKDGKTDQGKSSKGWHQIRAAAPAPKENVVEAAKHSEAEAEESPKAMAAAAASDDASSTADPNAIASIVDSVLADLRPRIVEEIAKKLAKK